LHNSSEELLCALLDALDLLSRSFRRIKKETMLDWFRDTEKAWGTLIAENEAVLQRLEKAIETYKNSKRLEVIRPFAHLFDPSIPNAEPRSQKPTHRALYWGFYYQWTLMNFTDGVLALSRDFVALEKKRTKVRIWGPALPNFANWHSVFQHGGGDEEDPEAIPGLESGLSAPRDPDHLPP
jgi:hypothetical protein